LQKLAYQKNTKKSRGISSGRYFEKILSTWLLCGGLFVFNIEYIDIDIDININFNDTEVIDIQTSNNKN
jgi:hypothetical protein